jgi:hypothetical protein
LVLIDNAYSSSSSMLPFHLYSDRGESLDMGKQWSLVLDLRHGCTDYNCNRTDNFSGLTFTYKR